MSGEVAGLVLVATPIGNLGELSPRAIELLAAADVIACEDTRRAGRLLQHAGITQPRLVVVNDHTESAATRTCWLRSMKEARWPSSLTPACRASPIRVNAWCRRPSTPGYAVSVVPGPSAAIAALVVSGLPTGRFVFEGFLPRKGVRPHGAAGRDRRTSPARSCCMRRRTACEPRSPISLQRSAHDRRVVLVTRADQAARGGVARVARARSGARDGSRATRRVRARRRRCAGVRAAGRDRHRASPTRPSRRGRRSEGGGRGGGPRPRRAEA